MAELMSQTLSDSDFDRLTRLVERQVGIHLPAHKRSMVELRVAKRARALGLTSLDEYCSHVFDTRHTEEESVSLIDILTTNKTDFFREADHFERLTTQVIPAIRSLHPQAGVERPFRVWSAGCSSGQEPYSIGMVLANHARTHPPFDFAIHGTDVCTRSLAEAMRAVYPEESVCPVPVEMRASYLLRHKDPSQRTIRVAPELRAHVRFTRHNLLSDTAPGENLYDAAFCRNVIIYFERETQIRVLRHILRSIVPGGFLFIGHSETLHGMTLAAERVGPMLYQKGVR